MADDVYVAKQEAQELVDLISESTALTPEQKSLTTLSVAHYSGDACHILASLGLIAKVYADRLERVDSSKCKSGFGIIDLLSEAKKSDRMHDLQDVFDSFVTDLIDAG